MIYGKQTLIDLSEQVGGGMNPYLFTKQANSVKLSHNADVTDQYEQIICYMLPHTSARRYWLEIVGKPALWKWLNVCPYSTPGLPRCVPRRLGPSRHGPSQAGHARPHRLVQQEPGDVLEPCRARDQAPQPTCTPQGQDAGCAARRHQSDQH